MYTTSVRRAVVEDRADVRMHELAPPPPPRVEIARRPPASRARCGCRTLITTRRAQLRLLGDVDVGHAAAAEAAQDAIAVAGGAAEARELVVGPLERGRARARAAFRCTARTPPTTRDSRSHTRDRTRVQPPNCMRTKSYGAQGPVTSNRSE